MSLSRATWTDENGRQHLVADMPRELVVEALSLLSERVCLKDGSLPASLGTICSRRHFASLPESISKNLLVKMIRLLAEGPIETLAVVVKLGNGRAFAIGIEPPTSRRYAVKDLRCDCGDRIILNRITTEPLGFLPWSDRQEARFRRYIGFWIEKTAL